MLALSPEAVSSLPGDVLEILTHGTNTEYLTSLSRLALDPSWTELIFSSYEPLFLDLVGRWTAETQEGITSSLNILTALSKVLSFCPRLATCVQEITSHPRQDIFCSAGRPNPAISLSDIPSNSLCQLLVLLLRLLAFDEHGFCSLVTPVQIQELCSHVELHIRYLACRVLGLLLHFTDKATASHVERYCGVAAPHGDLDGKQIDFRFYDAWEDQRIQKLQRLVMTGKKLRSNSVSKRIINNSDLCARVTNFAGYLAIVSGSGSLESDTIVATPVAQRNLKKVAESVCSNHATLVIGTAGSGKTALIDEVAKRFQQSSRMLTLYLNAQTDAKLLIGLYTSVVETGSFKWQPGVLTKAVLEGRWILIEDLDRAPSEVISVLLPLFDTGKLMVPNLGGAIRAAPGFKLIGTIRSSINSQGEESPIPNVLGIRHWNKVFLEQYLLHDLQQIISTSFPLLLLLSDRIMSMYNAISQYAQQNQTVRSGLRSPSLQELLRFCTRSSTLLNESGVFRESSAFPEAANTQIFLEAVDSFCAGISVEAIKSQMISIIAQELYVSAENVRFCVELRVPSHERKANGIKYGRVEFQLPQRLSTNKNSVRRQKIKRPFAQTSHSLRILESIASAVKFKTPCLLVGETGTGKTTIVQELADATGQKLFVVNLSQQSEVGDLFGGFKPVTLRALATPIKDEFDVLFDTTLKSNKNEKFLTTLARNFTKGQWSRVLRLWQEASKTAITALEQQTAKDDNPSKKRKLDVYETRRLSGRWQQLISDLEIFRKHIQSGSKGFAFSYMESNLVKAVRNGHWILLDEFNLAPQDTLESLADLLPANRHKMPSILLGDSGDIQRVTAHPDFRVFAAMNPATDVGKRDLPPGIRSRFAEYYISSCEDDCDSLVQICSAYLGDYVLSDRRIAHDVATLHQSIRALGTDNRLVDGAGQKPHFTLRSLSRTLMYATDIAKTYGIRRSLYEGFCMSFLTLLDRASIALVSPLIYQNLLTSHRNARSILHQIPKCPGENSKYVQFRHYWMAKGPFPVIEQPHYIITPFVEANLLNLVRATSSKRYPILLQGPTSSGKTSMIEYLANISGNKFVRINNHEHTDLQEYLGTYVSGLHGLSFQDGILVKALREGHWLVLDELNLAPTDILEALNRLLDDNRELLIPETQEVVRPHPDFMLFATQNPPGLYGGRKVLSRAFRNRFLELHFDDIPEDELETILRERSQIAPSFCNKIVEVYKRLAILRQTNRLFEQKNSFATLRDLFRWAFRDADNAEQLAINGFMLLCERIRDPSERDSIRSTIEEVMKIKIDETKLYALSHSQKEQIKRSGDLAKQVTMTKAMSRLYVLIAAALRHNEPVLLIGNTGCGKTTVCQMVAESMSTTLHILNAHQNTETGDIIGAQRPVRNRQQTISDLHTALQKLTKHNSKAPINHASTLEDLLVYYDKLSVMDKSQILPERHHEIDSLIAKSKALFEWADGILVTAMRAGHHFLLDEISLADDAVLERLNSVLETSRSLLLAEKGGTDAMITAHNDFQFLATMNPGGDYGKKELSPALRNRFTEIWVPELSDEEDVLSIINSKLINSLQELARPIASFARWFDRYCGENKAAPSLRQILALIEFLNLRQEIDTNTDLSIVHGAAMVYIDGIGADPAAKLYLSNDDISSKRTACLDQLSDLFGIAAHDIYYARYEILIQKNALCVGPFTIVGNNNTAQSVNFNLEAPTTIRNTLRVVRGLQIPKPILVEGSPGVGKTSLIEAIARKLGIPLTRINLSEQTDLMDLFGSDVPVENGSVGQFEWRDAPFLTAMQKGEWVLLDEMNLASQSVLEGLNACLDHRGQIYIPELDRSFFKHPQFTLFAAQNPHAQGGGRKGLPASFVNRFTLVYADPLITEDMVQISASMFPNIDASTISALASYIFSLNSFIANSQAAPTAGGPWEFNLRDLLRWLSLMSKSNSALSAANLGDFEDMFVLGRFRDLKAVEAVKTGVRSPFMDTSRTRTRYRNLGNNFIQCGFGFLQMFPIGGETVHIPGGESLAVLESVMIAVEQNWPCLLVGSSGSGKSRLLHGLASTCGADVVTLALNNAMDTMDIIGGYEQVDFTRHLKSLLLDVAQELRLLWAQSDSETFTARIASAWLALNDCDQNPQLLLDKLNYLVSTNCASLEVLSAELDILVQRMKNNQQAQFEWVDGALIKAMERGNWLILDNANLCNASVLDRLNALLEPAGILSLNEHRLEDGSPRSVSRHPNFRLFLTMDPRHGELSRAMRNRCVEVYQPAMDESTNSYKIDRVRPAWRQPRSSTLSKFDWGNLPSSQRESLLDITLSRYSIAEHLNFDALIDQVSKGLYSTQPQLQSLIRSAQQIFAMAFGRPSILDLLQQIHLDFLRLSYFDSKDLALALTEQPVDLTANTALTSMYAKRGALDTLVSFSELIEARLKLGRVQQNLVKIQDSLPHGSKQDLTRLERSVLVTSDRKFSNDSTAPVASMLNDLIIDLESQLDVKILSNIPEIQAVTKLTEFCQDLLDFTHCRDIDEGKLFAYVRLGRMLLQQQESTNASYSSYKILQHKLMLFGNVRVNQDMEPLWNYFKPKIFKSAQQLSQISKFQEIAMRLNNVVWKSSVTIKSIIELKATFFSIDSEYGDEQLWRLKEIEELVCQQEKDKHLEPFPIKLYFEDTYATLKQCTNIGSPTVLQYGLDELSVLGDESLPSARNAGISGANQSILLDLPSLFGSIEHDAYLSALRGDFSAGLVQKLQGVTSIPLRRLFRFQEEMILLCKHISDKTSKIVDSPYQKICLMFGQLMLDMLNAHQHLLEATSFTDWSTYIQALLDETISHPQKLHPSPLVAINNSAGHQASAVQNLLLQSLQLLTGIRKTDRVVPTNWSAMGNAWIHFSLTCLNLYLPDHPFDPALGPKLIHERWLRRKGELENQLAAFQLYESLIPGQPVDFRRRLLHEKLDALGEEPKKSLIVRPERSQIVELHAELLNIQRTVLKRVENGKLQALLDDSRQLDELRRHVQANIRRFSTGYEGYYDIAKPAISFLQALDVGLSLLSLSKNSETIFSVRQRGAHSSIDIFGLDLKYILRETPHRSLALSTAALDHRYVHLVYFRLYREIQDISPDSIAVVVADLFRQFYEEWKTKLSEEQTREAAQSSLYHFQDKHELSDADGDSLTALFPTFDQEDGRTSTSPRQSSPALLAQLLADLQAQIFLENKHDHASLAEFLVDVQERTLKACPPSKKHFYPFDNLDTLPSVLLALDKSHRYITNSDSQQGPPDFYNEPNLPAASKLIVLGRNVRSCFRNIQEAWPEHAIPGLILQTLEEILDCKHSEPLAKLITLAEKLHGFIHEWQSIASREFSAAALYDELTQLIISWRRIELSSWSRLLDREEEVNLQEAKSWWFIAYEAILHPLTDAQVSSEEAKRFSIQLSSELQNFIKTANLGQFATRLNILKSCGRQAAAMSQRFPLFNPVAAALSNNVDFFARWQQIVQDRIKQQRLQLDAKMRDIILLASWKDINIEALRASSRRSHVALFKIVKKYREVLATSVEPLLVSAPGHQTQLRHNTAHVSWLNLENDTERAISVCSMHWPDLSKSSKWIANPLDTASLMARVGKVPTMEFQPVLWLNSFINNLQNAIKSLQQETPSTLTAENKTIVKHLKARKRNLLTDTLRELRQMGIRSNLNDGALQNQSTTSKILAILEHRQELSVAREDFYAMLDNTSQIRSSAGKQTNDLSPQEATRSIGFLDGLLSQLITQHHNICSFLEELDLCDSILVQLNKLWQPAKYSVLLSADDEITIDTISKRLRWLLATLGLAIQLIDALTSMGQEDFTNIRDAFFCHEMSLKSLLTDLMECPNLLSAQLKTSNQADFLVKVTQRLHQLSVFVTETIDLSPNLRFILIHILPWLDLHNPIDSPLPLSSFERQQDSVEKNGLSPIQEINPSDLDNIVKQLLVGLQQYRSALDALSKSNDEAAWLIKHDEVLKTAGKSMHITSIMNNIRLVLLSKVYSTDQTLARACAISGLVLPVLQQYRNSFVEALNHRIDGYITLCRLANVLSASLQQLLTQGFCTPKEKSQLEQDTNQTDGVGLGEGEGAEDISKDVQDDEDLAELAQNAQSKQENSSNDHKADNEDDAVDLGEEDLDGQLDSEGEEGQGDENEGADKTEEDISEEVGDVDSLDPSAVDEKLWEDEADKEHKEKEGKAEGKQTKSNHAGPEDTPDDADTLSDAGSGSENLDEHTLDAEGKDPIDDYVNKEDNLELPEDMQMDSSKPLESDEDTVDGLSESSEQEVGEDDAQTDPDQNEMEIDDSNIHNADESGEGEEDVDQELQILGAEEEGTDTMEEEITKLQPDQPSMSNNTDSSRLDDQLGSGVDALQNEHKEEEAHGDHHNVGPNVSDTKAEDSSATRTAAQHGELAQNEPETTSKQSEHGQNEPEQLASAADPFRKLGEALEKWRRSQHIHEASQHQEQESSEQYDDVQHLNAEDSKSDAQVLGPATEDEVHALDENELAMEVDTKVPDPDSKVDGFDADEESSESEELNQPSRDTIEKADTFIGSRELGDKEHKPGQNMADYHHEARMEEKIDDIDTELSEIKLQASSDPTKSNEEARKLWQQCENTTGDLSLILTEQLRLILAPSLATKMRGDFRTGKRLNIKRIIPYIASGYKRDKIWMRRSVPSKRNYQIMLAVDDSKSMTESGGNKLAFEALALLSRSLTMLEVGQICIVSFGEHFRIAHNFDQQFSTEAAVAAFQHFNFNQTKTNVQNLMARSLEVFRDARARQASSNTDLWQLQLIISDGVCEDHEGIRRLVREAHEERIMIVFAVINSAGNHSILNMTQASFEPDENGETKLRIKRYLEGFPFPYYLIVGDVKNLPGVLSTALRQWFAEVVES